MGPVNGPFLFEFTKTFSQMSLCYSIFFFFVLVDVLSIRNSFFWLIQSSSFLKNLHCLCCFLFLAFSSFMFFIYRLVENRCTLRQHSNNLLLHNDNIECELLLFSSDKGSPPQSRCGWLLFYLTIRKQRIWTSLLTLTLFFLSRINSWTNTTFDKITFI